MTRLRLRQLAALAGTLVLLAGLPWLTTFLTWPSLDHSLLSWQVHLRSGRLPAGVGTATLIVAVWSVWGLYVLTLATELLARLRHRTVHLGPLRPLQLLAATTLGTITLAPTIAHAAPPVVAAADTPEEAEADEHEAGEGEQDSTEPMVVDRSRVIDDFGYDSAHLTEAMTEDVEDTADLIGEHGAPELPIVVNGHTDSAGDPDYNRDLSERRATAVADALRTHLGEGMVIEAQGEGDRTLLDTADDAEQRRVEINYSVVVAPPGEPSPSTPPEETDTADDSEATQQPGLGLSLPGGLVLAMTTAGLGVLGGMALERRHDLLPHRRSDQEEEESEDTAEHPPPSGSSTSVHTPDTTGEPHTELALVDLARAPGLGITGPGAHGAARTLLDRAMQASEDELNVVVPEADLRVLLDDPRRLPVLGEDAAVMVTETIEDALTLLQLQVLARHRADDEAAGEEAPPADDEPVGPQFVLLTRAEPEIAAEVTSLLAHTGPAPLSVVLLGSWPDSQGATCTIDVHGTITAAEEPFTDVVDHRWASTTTAQLLETLTHHPGTPAPAHDDTETDDIDDEQDLPETATSPSPSTNSTVSEASHAGAVSVSVLGPITLAVHGHQVRPTRRAAYEVLAYLAAHPTGVRLEAAVDAMWPHDAPHRGIRRFHDACTAVRSACREHLGEVATTAITRDDDRYQLNPHLVTCDLWRIEELLEEATHTHDPTPVTAAAAMFDQGFAATSDYLWAEGVRIRVRDPLVLSLIEHAESENPARAISMLKRALRIDPTSSGAAQALVARYDEKGDKKSAERVRSEYKEALDEMGTAS